MQQNTEVPWTNVRLVRTREGHAVIMTDTNEISLLEADDKMKFKVVGFFPEKVFGDFFGQCLAEVNDLPYMDDSAEGFLIETSHEIFDKTNLN